MSESHMLLLTLGIALLSVYGSIKIDAIVRTWLEEEGIDTDRDEYE